MGSNLKDGGDDELSVALFPVFYPPPPKAHVECYITSLSQTNKSFNKNLFNYVGIVQRCCILGWSYKRRSGAGGFEFSALYICHCLPQIHGICIENWLMAIYSTRFKQKLISYCLLWKDEIDMIRIGCFLLSPWRGNGWFYPSASYWNFCKKVYFFSFESNMYCSYA